MERKRISAYLSEKQTKALKAKALKMGLSLSACITVMIDGFNLDKLKIEDDKTPKPNCINAYLSEAKYYALERKAKALGMPLAVILRAIIHTL